MLLADVTIGVHEVAAGVGVLSGITAFLIALWMHDIKADVHDLVSKVSEHSERIARLETRVDILEKPGT